MNTKFGYTIQDLIDEGRVVRDDVETLKRSLKTDLSDEQLALFLISCDFDRNRAETTIANYFQIRQMAPEIFADRCVNGERLRNQLRVGTYCVLPKKTPNDCTVVVVNLQDNDYRKFDFETHLKLALMMLDVVAYYNPSNIIGVIDFKGTSFMHLTLFKLSLAKIFLRYVQEGLPLKLKEVHVLNGGYVFNCLYNLCKPFLRKELKEMLHFHHDMEPFHANWISKEFLPEEYGGDLDSVLVHQKNTIDKLTTMETYFEIDERQTRGYLSK